MLYFKLNYKANYTKQRLSSNNLRYSRQPSSKQSSILTMRLVSLVGIGIQSILSMLCLRLVVMNCIDCDNCDVCYAYAIIALL